MDDLIDMGESPAEARQNAPEFTVSEISGAVKRMVEGSFSHVRIRGELGRISRPASGHLYLDLKDDRAVLSAVIWKGVATRLATRPEQGMEVIATGRLTTFPGQSRYQMVIEHLAPAGIGALMAMLEKRKAALGAEGLFDARHKRPLPYLPEVIGVVTSTSGAVIRDILHRLRDRFPRKVLIWPVAVQGEKCAAEVVRGIEGFNSLTPGGALPRPDVLIVARGGGSVEDLWGFNEEIVVRAARASMIPLISAVGHETDTTLIDYASDFRAPTPSAAAEAVVPVRVDLMRHIRSLGERLEAAMRQKLGREAERLRLMERALPRPSDMVGMAAQRLDHVSARLPTALRGMVQAKRLALGQASGALRPALMATRLTHAAERLAPLGQGLSRALEAGIRQRQERLATLARLNETLGYRATLERGYAVLRIAQGEPGAGQILRDVAQLQATRQIEALMHDGSARLAPVDPPRRMGRTSLAEPSDEDEAQGQLF